MIKPFVCRENLWHCAILSKILTSMSGQSNFYSSSMSMSTVEILKEITPVKKKYYHFLESQIILKLIKFKY